MKKINTHIEIVRSTRNGLSSMSQESCEAIFGVLDKYYEKVGVTIINELSDLEDLTMLKPDLVFLGMKFVTVNHSLGMQDPAKVWLTDYLDEYDIAYTGSSQTAHELELDKPLAKQRALEAGIATSPFYVASQNQQPTEGEITLNFPLFVKPTNRGGGLGIDSHSVVHDFAELKSKIQSITVDVQSDSLVEEYLPGREFSVAILKDEDSVEFSVMPIELIAPMDKYGARILSAQVKSSDTEHFIEVTNKIIKVKITALAMDVFYALGARDYGRIDIRLDKNGTPQFLEANLIPSLIKGYGNFPKACLLNIGLDYEPMILSIVNLALARKVSSNENFLEPVFAHNTDLSSLEPLLEHI